jgi:hypothetical protein
MVYLRAEGVLIHTFAAIREAYSNAYPDEKVRMRQHYTDW